MIKYLLSLLVWTLALLGFHFFLVQTIFPSEWGTLKAYWAYLFLFILTAAIHIVLKKLSAIDAERVGMAFLASSTIKLIAGGIYLLPFILAKDESSRPVALLFFIPYFGLLVFESIQTSRIINGR
jgi:hypothetical protein